MNRIASSRVVIVAILLAGGAVYGEDWKPGEKWTYQHQGPRPFSDGTATVKGNRTMELIAIQGEGDQKRYLLKNAWGTEDANPTISHIDTKNLVHKIEIQALGTLAFEPPVPTFWSLKVDEVKTLATKMDFAGFAITLNYRAKRLADETVSVPAGTFADCQHVQITSTMQSDMLPPTKSKIDYWYHPKVKNMVKEVIVTNYEGDNSYTGTSVLKAHTKRD